MRALTEEGKHDEAEAVERQIQQAMQRFENARRGGAPFGELPPEVREQIEQLKRQHHEAAHAGNREEAQEIERKVQALIREHAPRTGDFPPRGEPGPEIRARAEELKRRLNEAREAGRRDEVAQLERQLQELIHAHRPDAVGPREGFRTEGGPGNEDLLRVLRELREEVGRLRREVDELKGRGPREGDRPRPDAEGRRPNVPREGDRPRFDGPPREDDRPDFRPDRPRREERRPDGPPEGRERPDRERPEGDRPDRERPEGDRPDAERPEGDRPDA
jgi:hypothetical protein